ncbi:MAG: ThuA domain-containing protein [Kiritimatiellaeota bacterium]|nr:ThuA domain-containing protein [Kiritimatiellota bacterium]
MQRRSLSILCLLGAMFSAHAAPAAEAAKLRVTLLSGLNHHPWQQTTPAIVAALEASGRFTVTEVIPPSPADQAASTAFHIDLSKTDVVVNNWTDYPVKLPAGQTGVFPWMDEVLRFVRSGGGFVGIHAASFERHPEFLRLAGLHWRSAKAGDRIALDDAGKIVRTPKDEGPATGHGHKFEWKVTTRQPQHPIMAGLPAEWLHVQDELWHATRGPAEQMEILATALSPVTKANEPMLWTVSFGQGRVFMTMLGHDGLAMSCLGFRTVLARGTEWAATGKVTLPVPADFPRDKPVTVPTAPNRP